MQITSKEKDELLDLFECNKSQLTYDKCSTILTSFKRLVLIAKVVSSPKHIKYSYEIKDKIVYVKITEQSHRCEDFGSTSLKTGNDCFVASSGIYLYSCGEPENSVKTGKSIFVRGSGRERDNKETKYTVAEFKIFQQVINEYNEYFKEA